MWVLGGLKTETGRSCLSRCVGLSGPGITGKDNDSAEKFELQTRIKVL